MNDEQLKKITDSLSSIRILMCLIGGLIIGLLIQ